MPDNDSNFWKKLTVDPTFVYKIKFNTVTDNFKKQNSITEKTANSLKLENPIRPKLCTSPKIH